MSPLFQEPELDLHDSEVIDELTTMRHDLQQRVRVPRRWTGAAAADSDGACDSRKQHDRGLHGLGRGCARCRRRRGAAERRRAHLGGDPRLPARTDLHPQRGHGARLRARPGHARTRSTSCCWSTTCRRTRPAPARASSTSTTTVPTPWSTRARGRRRACAHGRARAHASGALDVGPARARGHGAPEPRDDPPVPGRQRTDGEGAPDHGPGPGRGAEAGVRQHRGMAREQQHQTTTTSLRPSGTAGGSPRTTRPLWVKFNLRAHHLQAQTLARRFAEAEDLYLRIDQIISTRKLPERVADPLFDASPRRPGDPAPLPQAGRGAGPTDRHPGPGPPRRARAARTARADERPVLHRCR